MIIKNNYKGAAVYVEGEESDKKNYGLIIAIPKRLKKWIRLHKREVIADFRRMKLHKCFLHIKHENATVDLRLIPSKTRQIKVFIVDIGKVDKLADLYYKRLNK